jgi:hypothetical protein
MWELIKDLIQFLWERKQWWLFPVLFSLVLISLLIAFGGSTAVSPFIYSIF